MSMYHNTANHFQIKRIRIRAGNVRFEGADDHGGVVRLGQLARQLHVVVAQEIRPNCFDLHVSELLPAASVTATAEAEPAITLRVPAHTR